MFDALLHGASLENARINELSDMFLSAQQNLSALHLPVRLFKGVQHVSAAPFAACRRNAGSRRADPAHAAPA
jgi:formate C-acetyltransferase